MSRVEITEDMVERAIAATCFTGPIIAGQIRAALEAALNPPAKPEIEVTDEMCKAGSRTAVGSDLIRFQSNSPNAAFAAIYRAMYAARPNDDGVKQARPFNMHSRKSDNIGKLVNYIVHRRKGDSR